MIIYFPHFFQCFIAQNIRRDKEKAKSRERKRSIQYFKKFISWFRYLTPTLETNLF